MKTNIKVWVLTGDKMETAKEIAKSCNLIKPGFEEITLKVTDNMIKANIDQTLKDLHGEIIH